MTKTSTSLHTVNYPNQQSVETTTTAQAKNQDEMFYDSIKPQLDKLFKDPSDETIKKILAHSKKK